jgi:hypothetical protein
LLLLKIKRSLIAATKRGSTVLEEFSYDPWGRRRNPNNWNNYEVTEPTLFTRGFTGHGAIKNISKLTYSNRTIGTQRWIVRNNLHKGLRNAYNTNYEFFGTAQLQNMIEILTLRF